VTEPLRELLRKRKKTHKEFPWPFASRTGNVADGTTIYRDFKRVARRCGLDWLSPQAFRRAFATLNAASLPPLVLKQLLGHADLATTQRFYIEAQGMGTAAKAWRPIPIRAAKLRWKAARRSA
jgi:integrase